MAVLCAALAWTTFAFGGIYAVTLLAPAAACVALAAVWRPALCGYGPAPRLDWLLLAVLAAVLLQIVPLPRPVLRVVAPAAESVARTLALVQTSGPLPVSVDAGATAVAAALYAGLLVVFLTARELFVRGGVRTTVRAIAFMGLILSAVALAQDATAHGLMYWRWRPIDEGPAPFGPYVNRNHFASWALMAVPLVVGYLAAHASAHQGAGAHATWQRKMVAAIQARTVFLLASAILLIVAIAASLSRSGLVGLAAALVCGAILARTDPAQRSRSTRAVILIVALGGVALLLVLVRVGPGAITGRFATSGVAVVDRLTIWRDTLLILSDFWLTGTGAGTYQTAMMIYQRSSPGILFNQAHNHFLQVAAEGGLLVSIPVLLALSAFAREAWRSLLGDRSGMYWVRVGAVCGLFGAAVQSLFETGLTTPANGMLAVILAAVATHVTPGASQARVD